MAFVGPGRVEAVEVPRPVAPPGWVLLRTLAAGVCHTDLHLRSGTDGRLTPGRILGHEICGAVEEVGDGVVGWAPGTRVAVHPSWSCGECAPCLAGRRQACLRTTSRLGTPTTPGISADGGMAEFIAVPASALVDVGDLDPALAATMTDAALSPYGSIAAVRERLAVGAWAVVIGLGGLGSMAVQILRATTAAHVIALDVDDAALDRTRRFADHTLRSDAPDVVVRALELTGGPGAAVVFDFVGVDATLELAVDLVAPFGAVQVSGMGGGTLTLRAASAGRVPRGVSISPRLFSGSLLDLLEVLELARSGSLQPDLVEFPFAEADVAFEELAAGRIGGRAVLRF